MSLKFLNLKSFHPANQANQKRVWVAEQKAKAREQQEAEAAREVLKNADAQRFQRLAAAQGDAEAARRLDAQQVGFLYEPPPGLQKAEAPARDGDEEDGGSHVAEDDAAREFRRKMERRRGAGPADDARRNLERYVGRRPDEPLTIKDQVERFPFLKDAPVEGAYTDSVKVNFKPMGRQLRNVRCLRCGQWGHQSGDRECELRDFNPHDAARQVMEDPMTHVKSAKQQLVLRRAALPLEMQGEAATDEFAILPSDEEDPEREFLAKLSTKEKKRLLKKLKEQAERGHNDSGDSSSSSSSDSDSSSDRRRRHRHKRRSKKRRKEKKRRDDHRHDYSHRANGDEGRSDRRHHHEKNTASSRRESEGKTSRKRRSRSRSRSRSERRRHRH